MDNDGTVTTTNGESFMVWKDVKKWNTLQEQLQVNALEANLEQLKLDEISGESLDKTAKEITKEPKKTENTANQE